MTKTFVNKEYFENMSPSEKVWHFSSDKNKARFAYDRLIRHLCAASTQMQRINAAITNANSNKPDKPDLSDPEATREFFEQVKKSYDIIFIEIHFYFVAWANCQNMMKTLTSLPEYRAASVYYNSVRKHFDSYSEARNTFEHFHDRLPSGKYYRKVKEIQEPNAGPRRVFGGLVKGTYRFSDRSWDITPKSLELLNSLVREFLDIIHTVVDKKCNELLDKA